MRKKLEMMFPDQDALYFQIKNHFQESSILLAVLIFVPPLVDIYSDKLTPIVHSTILESLQSYS